ncbi:putative UDP-glucuronate:xylan alpha-glucuronosyltransferase 4 [Abeliophyllum distichum]|uniref:Hexosyltransferase n=1 Tax=Abeliophyllum distichum TaxID=126358 RepID=A0ABD1RQ39_9LAMI
MEKHTLCEVRLKMASKLYKSKPFTFSFILLLMAFLFLTINCIRQVHTEFQNESLKNPGWFDVVAPYIRHEKINIGLVNMDGVVDNIDHGHGLQRRGSTVKANLLVRSRRKNNGPVFAVFTGDCIPMWEIFKCDDVLWHKGNYWVYKPELTKLKQKVLMPVGTCQPATPILEPSGQEIWRKYDNKSKSRTLPQPREAYVTVLHSSEDYVCGAIALAQSIIQTNTTKDLVLLADVDRISEYSLKGLQAAGWKIKPIRRIRSPHAKRKAYNEYNYSKLRIWQLIDYDRVMFIDSDLIVLKNIDKFFNYPQLSAVGNNKHIFNSGLMLIEPSICTFKTLLKKRFVVASYNGGDQGFLNEMFPWWHRLPVKLNYIKYFNTINDQLHEIPHDLYALHFVGMKPWMCYQDYDCNWDSLEQQIFASDMAHERWWNVYNGMSKKLKQYCSLTSETDARIQTERANARNATFVDGHWKIKIYGDAEIVNIHFKRVEKNIQWSDLFPLWIEESLPWDLQPCLEIPLPRFEEYVDLDVVVAKVPCGGVEKRIFEDVFRLQINLVVANLLVRNGLKNGEIVPQVYVVFIGNCSPVWELFRCDDLLWHEQNFWIYKPDLRRLKQKLLLPVGSCQLAPPFAKQGTLMFSF